MFWGVSGICCNGVVGCVIFLCSIWVKLLVRLVVMLGLNNVVVKLMWFL